MTRLLRVGALLAVLAIPVSAARADLTLPRVSPKATVTQGIGTTDLKLVYSRPGVKSRAIWGALVPYDAPWRTGANEATEFTTSDSLLIAGQKLAAGTYFLLTIPKAGEWTVIFSSQKGLQGSTNYDPKHDALRVTAKPDTTQPHQEWMWLGFEDLTNNSCNLVLRWEQLRLDVPILIDVNGKVLANARAEADDWRTPMRAAAWCLDNDLALGEGKVWLERSLGIQQAHANLALKARWLMKENKKPDAIAAAKKAIEVGKASKETVDTSGTEKLLAEWVGGK